MSENWVDGTYESGSDDDANEPIEPTPADGDDAGVEIGLGEGSTFEPEEDTEAP